MSYFSDLQSLHFSDEITSLFSVSLEFSDLGLIKDPEILVVGMYSTVGRISSFLWNSPLPSPEQYVEVIRSTEFAALEAANFGTANVIPPVSRVDRDCR